MYKAPFYKIIYCQYLLLLVVVVNAQTESQSSVNPTVDPGVSVNDLMQVDVKSIFDLANAQESAGMLGVVDGNAEIRLKVYHYLENTSNGLGTLMYDIFTNSTLIEYGGTGVVLNTSDFGPDATYFPAMWQSGNIKQSSFGVDRWNYQQLVDHQGFTGIYDIFQEQIPVVIVATTTAQTSDDFAFLTDFKIPGIGKFDAPVFFDYQDLIRSSKFREVKKIKFHILEDPSAVQNAEYYRTEISEIMNHVNNIYLHRTGNVKPLAITATVSNTRMTFSTIEIVLYSAAMGTYPIDNFNVELNQIGKNFDDNAVNFVLAGHFSDKPGYILNGLAYCIHCDPPLRSPDVYDGKEFIIIAYEDIFDDTNRAGTTISHEMGHIFNLQHPFESECGDGDGIIDTPFAQGPFWKSPGTRIRDCTNPPSCNGIRRQIENVMDYGPCRWMFTRGQLAVMNKMLSNPHRTNLYTEVVRNSAYFENGVPLDITLTDLRNPIARPSNEVERDFAREETLVYPNPVTSTLKIEISVRANSEATLQLIDLSGRLILTQKNWLSNGRNNIALYVSHISKGTYLVQVNVAERSFSETVIVN